MGTKVGVAIIGVNGAVSSTVIAGTELMKAKLAPRLGMVTEKSGIGGESPIADLLDFEDRGVTWPHRKRVAIGPADLGALADQRAQCPPSYLAAS